MDEKLSQIEEKYEKLQARMADPATYADPGQYAALAKEQKELEPVVAAWRKVKGLHASIAEAEGLLGEESDPELRALAQEELESARAALPEAETALKALLLPKDPNDSRNVIIELRGGVGGEESALFAASLYRMYSMYAERRGWQVRLANMNDTDLGGIKEASFIIEGEGAYSRLKFESGVHRVQRVPETETQGRVHTSTATVAVLPELDEVDFKLDMSQIRIDVFRSSGAGGQKVNKTETAIRVTHIPTNTVVECQDERSQYKNKARALSILASRLAEAERQKQADERADTRRHQIGTGMRNERIRTYNFPQGRVTDHRIGLTLYKIDSIMNGDLDELIDALITADQAERLRQEG
ncbi:MAG: peptide chain release factor 1 [Oscillospiraceae bacterium]|nr:peptide chain release factor 1 [Oscillospiraceae bacterium]